MSIAGCDFRHELVALPCAARWCPHDPVPIERELDIAVRRMLCLCGECPWNSDSQAVSPLLDRRDHLSPPDASVSTFDIHGLQSERNIDCAAVTSDKRESALAVR